MLGCLKDFSELWHAHNIHIKPVLDMQLLRIYEEKRSQIGVPGWIKLEGMYQAYREIMRTSFRPKIGLNHR